MSNPLILGVTGGSGSGKSYFVRELIKQFNPTDICLVTQDNYYKPFDNQPVDEKGVVNFDLLESIDHKRLIEDIKELKKGNSVRIKEYTFNNQNAKSKYLTFQPSPVILVEGLMIFSWPDLKDLIDYSIFIDADDLIKVKRRIIRDAKERGYDLDDVLYRYEHHVAPFYHHYLQPIKKEMDLVIPNNFHFKKGLEVVTGFIRFRLNAI